MYICIKIFFYVHYHIMKKILLCGVTALLAAGILYSCKTNKNEEAAAQETEKSYEVVAYVERMRGKTPTTQRRALNNGRTDQT